MSERHLGHFLAPVESGASKSGVAVAVDAIGPRAE
jgi:hypothetical protein